MNVVTLVPFRGGDFHREASWARVAPELKELGYLITLGNSDGPWSRAAACNNAARAAQPWDIALIADSDTLLEKDAVELAIEVVAGTRGAARPHNRRWLLSLANTQKVLRGHPVSPGMLTHSAPGGGALVVHRDAWNKVGGYDESFVEWGHEDSALNISLVTQVRWQLLPGNAYHLWHSPSNRGHRVQANRLRLKQYQDQHKAAIARESAIAGFDLNEVL